MCSKRASGVSKVSTFKLSQVGALLETVVYYTCRYSNTNTDVRDALLSNCRGARQKTGFPLHFSIVKNLVAKNTGGFRSYVTTETKAQHNFYYMLAFPSDALILSKLTYINESEEDGHAFMRSCDTSHDMHKIRYA